jgi:hypothetical protein
LSRACQEPLGNRRFYGASDPRLAQSGVTVESASIDHDCYTAIDQVCAGSSFDEAFESVDECVLAAFDEGAGRLARALGDAAECQSGWRERVGAALVALLAFLDEQPSWARFLILEPAVATSAICERRQRALSELARVLAQETRKETRRRGARGDCLVTSSRLGAELVVGGVFSVIQRQLRESAVAPLTEIAPSLLAFVIGPGESVQTRPRSERLPVRATYRTARVLRAIGAAPWSNNREIADAAGLRDEGQTSKLLRRLEQRGLVQNVGLGSAYGEPNAWLLTSAGERAMRMAPEPRMADALPARGQIARDAA